MTQSSVDLINIDIKQIWI